MEEYKACHICPRVCGADRTAGGVGFCGADDKMVIARAALHAWEEPPISGVSGSGAVFFAHCSLGCVYCQNREISRRQATGKTVSVEQLADIFFELAEQGAHNINLVTGTHYIPHIIKALRLARARGLAIPTVWNSSGYETINALKSLEGLIDIYLPDYKYYSSYYAERYSGAADYPEIAREVIGEMLRQVGKPLYDGCGILKRGVIIRHLMLPGLSRDTAQVLRFIAEHWRDDVLVSLMRQYTPFNLSHYPEINRVLTDSEYEEAAEQFVSLGLIGFLQEGEAIGTSFIPSFGGEGV